MKIILASTSPRRLAFLEALGYDVKAVASHVTELEFGLPANELSLHNAVKKARAVHKKNDGSDIVLGADTVVALGDEIFGKPVNENMAADMLKTLSGKRHQVVTSYCLINQQGRELCRSISSNVFFRELSQQEMAAYIRTNEWKDKSGGYACQGFGAALIRSIEGSLSNVIGLPVDEVLQDIKSLL